MKLKNILLHKSFFITIGIVLLLSAVSGFYYLLTNNKLAILYNDGYQPDQAIPFSHKLHAGKYKIDCRYCHAGVEISRRSSLPSLNICMNCHRTVKSSSPWIKKITTAYAENQAISWKKVNLLPDFVRFSHFHHIKAGKSCTTCHGQVETMDVLSQHSSLSMGWCVNCHRKAPEEDGAFLKDQQKLKHQQAPVNCSTCHY